MHSCFVLHVYPATPVCLYFSTVQLDSVSFFPSSFSYGASSEVAAIATLLAVLQQLGEIKRSVSIVSCEVCMHT